MYFGLNNNLGKDMIVKTSKLIVDSPNKIKNDPKIAIKSNNKSIILYKYYYIIMSLWRNG